MSQDLKLTLRIDASGNLIGTVRVSKNELADLQKEFGGTGRAADTAGNKINKYGKETDKTNKKTKNLKRNTDSLRMGFLSLKGLLPTIGLGLVAKSWHDTIAAGQSLRSRLTDLAGGTAEYAQESEYLIETSRRMHTDINALRESYAGLLTLEKAGIVTRKEARDITEGMVNVQTRLGASSAQLSQTMFGLSQGLSSGVLRAEELNQVVEPLPGLLQKLDRAAGLSAGGFRQMVNDGQVTSAFFKSTLIDALQSYEGAAASMADNLTQSWTDVGNEYRLMVESLEAPIAGALVPMLHSAAEIIPTVVEYVDNLAVAIGTAGLAGGVMALTNAVAAAGGVTALIAAIAASPVALVALASAAVEAGYSLAVYIVNANDAAQKTDALSDATDRAVTSMRQIGGEFAYTAGQLRDLGNIAELKTYEKQAVAYVNLGKKASNLINKFVIGAISAAEFELQNKILTSAVGALGAAMQRTAKSAQALTDENKRNLSAAKSLIDPVNEYKRSLLEEIALVRKSAVQKEKATRTAKLTAAAAAAEAKGKKDLANRYRELILEVVELVDKKHKLIKQYNDQDAIKKEIEGLSLQYAKVTLNDRAFYDLTLKIRGWDQAQRNAALALYDTIDALEKQKDAAKLAADEMKRAHDNLTDDLTNWLIDGFSGAENIVDDLVDTVKNGFKDMVLRPLIRPIVSAITQPFASIAGGFNAPAQGGTASSAGGLSVPSFDFSSLFSNSFGDSLRGLGSSFNAAIAPTDFVGPPSPGLFNGAADYSNLQYGAVSIAASLIGDKLFGGYGGTGASLGTTLAMAAGLGPIGIVLAGLAGGALGGLFGDEEAPTRYIGRVSSGMGFLDDPKFDTDKFDLVQDGDIYEGYHKGNRRNVNVMTEFGMFGIGAQHVGNDGQQSEEAIQGMLDNVKQQLLVIGVLDERIADMLTESEIDAAKSAIDNLPDEIKTKNQQNIEGLLTDRYDAMFSAIDNDLATLYKNMRLDTPDEDGEVLVAAAVSLFDSMDAYKNVFTDFDDALHESQKTLWDRYNDSIIVTNDLASAYDGTYDSTLELTAALGAQRAMELELLGQINAARVSINGTENNPGFIDSTIDKWYLSTLTDEGKYNFANDKVEELMDSMHTLTDPAEILSTLGLINQWADYAFNLQTDEAKAQNYQASVDTLETAKDDANIQLDAAEETVETNNEDVLANLDSSFEIITADFKAAAADMQAAADTMNAAADKPVNVDVTVTLSNGSTYDLSTPEGVQGFSNEVGGIITA